MRYDYPLLKYACAFEGKLLHYRGQVIDLSSAPLDIMTVLRSANGRTSIENLADLGRLPITKCADYFEELASQSLIVDGSKVLRQDGLLSGLELFWRLEALLLQWRGGPCFANARQLDQDIASGRASIQQVRGLCLELGHLLRAVPEELALAVSNAPSEAIRLEFMDFYDEEARHGELLLEALVGWLGTEAQIRAAPPIPTTVGLLQTYRNWATKDPLMYAVALMRDEMSPLDGPVRIEEDIYAGMRKHYDVPVEVIDRFEWHALLDQHNDHGFFAERIFQHVPLIDQERAVRLIGTLRQIVELHEAFRWGVQHYYAEQVTDSRCRLAESVTESWRSANATTVPERRGDAIVKCTA